LGGIPAFFRKRQDILQTLAARPDLFGRQGVVVATWRSYRGRRLGPYYRVEFRHGDKHQSIYLGACAGFAEEVRQWLRDLKRPIRQERAYRRERAKLRAVLRRQKHRLDVELEKIGLYLKGYEVRGFRRARDRNTVTGH
jgi:tRNA/tmRNA/rRNA uracil-C5-methylase (TrmA/RlmC/RlmD family)